MPHRRWMTTIHRRQAKTWPNRVVGLGNQIGAARNGPRRRCMNRGGDPLLRAMMRKPSNLIS
jgi:hypothetical protein